MTNLNRSGFQASLLLFFLLLSMRTGMSQALEGTIVYQTFDNKQIRLIEPDGSNDRLLWELPYPEAPWHITGGPEWSPDGTKIAFTSDFDIDRSYYQSDLYTIAPDGSDMKRVTNAPNPEDFDRYPKGSVTIKIVNYLYDVFTYFIYVAGAPKVMQVSLAPNIEYTFTIENVADFGEGVQQLVSVHGPPHTWIWPSITFDVVPGQNTTSLSTFEIHNENKAYDFGAYGATWTSDSRHIGYRFIRQGGFHFIEADAPVNTTGQNVFNFGEERPPQLNFFTGFVFSPLPSEPDRFLYILQESTDNIFEDVYQVYTGRIGDTDLTEAHVYTSADDRILGLCWLPDGSGFLVAVASDFLQHTTFWKYEFETESLSEFQFFQDTWAGGMSYSPDGEYIVYEKVSEFGDFYEIRGVDLWIMRKDGTDHRLLAENAQTPDWGKPAVTTAATPEPSVDSSKGFELSQNSPNPFHSTTGIHYSLPLKAQVAVKVFDHLGMEVAVLVDEEQTAGNYSIRFPESGKNLAAGLYYYSLTVRKGEKILFTQARKMLLSR